MMREVQFLVLDEADQMLQVGFAEDVETILEKLPAKRSRLKAEALSSSMRWELVVELGQMEVHEIVYMGFFLIGRQEEYGFGRPGGNRGSDEMGGYAGSSSSCFGSNHQSGNFGGPAVWSRGFGELGKSDHSGSFGARPRWALMLMMIESLDKDPYKFFKVSMISDPCFMSPNSFDALGLVILPHNGFLASNIWHRFRLLFQPLGWDKHVQMPIGFGSMASVAGVIALSLHIEKHMWPSPRPSQPVGPVLFSTLLVVLQAQFHHRGCGCVCLLILHLSRQRLGRRAQHWQPNELNPESKTCIDVAPKGKRLKVEPAGSADWDQPLASALCSEVFSSSLLPVNC
ncbi:hypothetical protein PVK06_029743 [Gossypium arboreum]|uniref:Uncharacterized protein n=1 Tax=Gossypium arboreum TaxID=29729 RepID=A0ABR0NLF1_GOSAR|nr:hypothetical protein PVK06_029743 [Gossypium arboreum]